MRFSQTELHIIRLIHLDGKRHINEIATALQKSEAQIYRAVQHLIKAGFVERKEGNLRLVAASHSLLLGHLLAEQPHLSALLADSGIDILSTLLEPKTLQEIIDRTRVKRAMVFKKLKEAKDVSLIKQESRTYTINERIWPKVRESLAELKRYGELVDARVPSHAIIHFKNEKEILFSMKEEIDAAVTGFSAYGDYGIRILNPSRNYYLPKRKLTKKEIFLHSLKIAEKENSTRYRLYVVLFYLRFRKELKGIEHRILESIDKILHGQAIPEYPTLKEIKEKAEIYNIEVKWDDI